MPKEVKNRKNTRSLTVETPGRNRRSDMLNPIERTKFILWMEGCINKADAAEQLNISTETLRKIRLTGRASPETLSTVRANIN